MTSLFPDTSPDAHRVLVVLLRNAPAWRKAQMVDELTRTVRTLALRGLEARHPGGTPDQLRRRLADLLLGPQLALRVYGPADED